MYPYVLSADALVADEVHASTAVFNAVLLSKTWVVFTLFKRTNTREKNMKCIDTIGIEAALLLRS
jgi:hypothetical protein